MELPEYREIDGVKYYMIGKTGYNISKAGVVISRRNKPVTMKFRNNNQMVNINGKQLLVYKIILEVFYGKVGKDVDTYVLYIKDGNREIVTYDTITPVEICVHCELVRPGVAYVIYQKNATKYILFENGELYNIKLRKYLMIKKECKTPKYVTGNVTMHVKNILIESFGSTEMRNHKSRYELAKLNGGYTIIPITVTDDNITDEMIDEQISNIAITKYMCKDCKLQFKAVSIKQVIKLGKQCILCKKFVTDNPGKPIVIHNISDTSNSKFTCKRCLAGYSSKIDVCTRCDCIDIVKK